LRVALLVKYTEGSFFINFSRKFAAELARLGIDVTIVAGVPKKEWKGGKASIHSNGVKEVHVPYPSVSLHWRAGFLNFPSWVLDDITFSRSMASYLDGKYDVVQADSPLNAAALRRYLPNQRIFYSCIDSYISRPNFLSLRDRMITRFFHEPVELMGARASDKVVCITPSVMEFFEGNLGKSPKLELIPLGVDTDLFHPTIGGYGDIREKYGLARKTTIVFVGRLIHIKGVDILLSAVAMLMKKGIGENIRVLIVGPFSDVLSYTTRSQKSAGLRSLLIDSGMKRIVTFTGPVDHETLSKILASSDVFVLPSRAEALGVVLLEAMSSGLPVVGTRVGGIANVIRDGENGYLVSPNNPEELANRLLSLSEMPELRSKLGSVGRKDAVAMYSWRVIAEQFASLYTAAD
jgi:glycosyltransferase involved in cell wall biosynthesis